jgi:serine/threonine-protein kinase RsbW
LVDVENLVDRVCQTVGIQEDAFGNVLIAVTEAVNNAISHGNNEDSTLNIEVAVGDSLNSFCFRINDQGKGFDYHNLPDPTAPENILKENGRGIFLMRNLSDDVVFNDVGNEVIIYFSK